MEEDSALWEAIGSRYRAVVAKHFTLAERDCRRGNGEAMRYLESEDALCLAVILGYTVGGWTEKIEKIRERFVEKQTRVRRHYTVSEKLYQRPQAQRGRRAG